MPIIFPPPPELVDSLGQSLRHDDVLGSGTFSNAPAPPMLTLADVVRAAFELNGYLFRERSRWWFQDAAWREFRELSAQQQEVMVRAFIEPKMLLGVDPGFESRSTVVYAAQRGEMRGVRPGFSIVDEAATLCGKRFRRCADCGAQKRTLKRQRYRSCAACRRR